MSRIPWPAGVGWLDALALLLTVVVASPAAAQRYQYGWTLSSSSTDPFENSGGPANRVTTLYLWLACAVGDGVAAAEFDLCNTSGLITPLAFTPQNGFLNAGGTWNLLLAVGGCPYGPVVAGRILVHDLGGELCLTPSFSNGNHVSVDCQPNPTAWPNGHIGYRSDGEAPCREVCVPKTCLYPEVWAEYRSKPAPPGAEPQATAETSWGNVKASYR